MATQAGPAAPIPLEGRGWRDRSSEHARPSGSLAAAANAKAVEARSGAFVRPVLMCVHPVLEAGRSHPHGRHRGIRFAMAFPQFPGAVSRRLLAPRGSRNEIGCTPGEAMRADGENTRGFSAGAWGGPLLLPPVIATIGGDRLTRGRRRRGRRGASRRDGELGRRVGWPARPAPGPGCDDWRAGVPARHASGANGRHRWTGAGQRGNRSSRTRRPADGWRDIPPIVTRGIPRGLPASMRQGEATRVRARGGMGRGGTRRAGEGGRRWREGGGTRPCQLGGIRWRPPGRMGHRRRRPMGVGARGCGPRAHVACPRGVPPAPRRCPGR